MQEAWNWTNAKGGEKKKLLPNVRKTCHHGNVHMKMVQESGSFTSTTGFLKLPDGDRCLLLSNEMVQQVAFSFLFHVNLNVV